ncbi:MAG: M23 family metallopeptidase, partial [Gammaproteobacteria bacterium]
HNNRLIVGQGDSVERGQTIAEMGIGPERQPQLHFEIRRNGSPVDPLDHLPR